MNMNKGQILDIIDSVALNGLSYNEKALILAEVKYELDNKRFASNVHSLVLDKINDFSKNNREAQIVSKDFQDFSETENYPKAFEITNKEEIDQFLEKMSSKDFEGTYFDDTFEFYHPTDVFRTNESPMHRSNFNA
jgi:hypothetical protein